MKMNGITANPNAVLPVFANAAAKPMMKQNPNPIPVLEMIHMGRRPIYSLNTPNVREATMLNAAKPAFRPVMVSGSLIPTDRRTGAR
jgi:hypothetical protein